jgi:uncharacterized membrane protein
VTPLRPTPAEERWLELAARLRADRRLPWVIDRGGGWRRLPLFTRAAFFVLGTVAASLTAGIFTIVHLDGSVFLAGLVLLGTAEWLILGRRFFGTGIEEALELAGLTMIVFQFLDGRGDPEFVRGALLIAVAFLAAGLRLLNPLFTTLGALALTFVLGVRAGHGQSANEALASAAACYALGAVALLLGRRTFSRPSHDRMLDWLVIAMPVAGFVWIEGRLPTSLTLATVRSSGVRELAVLGVPLAYGLASLLAGLRRRRHAPLIACLACIACVGYELRNLTGLALEFRLIVWGTLALIVTLVLDRWLRTPRGGVTSLPIAKRPQLLGLTELAAAASLTPSGAGAGDPRFSGGGGTYGGGGASGDV